MTRFKALSWRVVVLATCLLLLAVPVLAQGGVLTYGGGTSGTFSATAPLAFYSFTGNTDDLVSIQVLALSPGLQPAIALNAPNQQQLAFNAGDPFNPGTARITYKLTQTGLYTILVSSNGGTGDFAVRLDGGPAPQAVPVSDNAPSETTLDATVQSQVFSVQANPDSMTTVTISSNTPGFEFTAVVRNNNGQTIATFVGNDTQPILATIPQGTGTFDIEVRPSIPATQGNIQVTIGLVTQTDAPVPPPPTATVDAPPATTEEAPGPIATEEVTDACRAVNASNNAVNVRSGPGTAYNIVGTFQPNTERAVIGVNTATGWYVITTTTSGQGWVLNTLVTLVGNCSGLTEIPAPDPSVIATPVPPTATYTPTTGAGQPTATYTPSYTPTTDAGQPTATPTPSYTPTLTPQPQIAPEDPRFNNPLTIPLDSTASVLDFVSYPGGDTEDRVAWDITGMNSNSSLPGGRARLVISATCFGENTDQIQFFTGGNTYACGQTIVDREVTFNSKTGSVVITAVGGQGTYVQWVLTGTATRINN